MITELAEGPGMEMLLLSQAGIPPVAHQADLTPLQKDVLLEAMRIQSQQQADAMRQGGARGR
ncbi:MAG: hypothetical protein HY678_02780 [Chloroflexi bacterium]|nr:hypothetical protein [Chloroflexota bacterium]